MTSRLTLIDYVIRVLQSDSSFKIRERPRPMNQEMSLRTPDPLSAFREGLGTRLSQYWRVGVGGKGGGRGRKAGTIQLTIRRCF